jgi:hypothetical protein
VTPDDEFLVTRSPLERDPLDSSVPNIGWPVVYGEGPVEEERKIAETDLVIERADLGVGAYTLVNAGDPIPKALEHLPRGARPGAVRVDPKARRPRRVR